MAARIPQMYEVRRAHPSAGPRASPPPSPPSNNPFATPNSSVTNLNSTPADYSGIGSLLLSNLDQHSPSPPKIREGRARSSTIVSRAEYQAGPRIVSMEGELDDRHDSFFSDASGPIAPGRVGTPRSNFPTASPTPNQRAAAQFAQQAQAQMGAFASSQAPHFSAPADVPQTPPLRISPSPHSMGSPRHNSPHHQQVIPPPRSTSSAQGPAPGGHGPSSILQPRPQRPTVQVALPVFPADAPPVSPMLAAPPRAHFSPMCVSPSPSNADNASIRGHDFLREKNATFREGEEEVFTPFSPHARQAGPRTRAGGRGVNGRKSVYSTVDFWKRLSTVAKNGQGESEFLMNRKKSIWRNPMFVFPLMLTLIAVTAIIIWLVIKVSNTAHV